MNYLLRRQRAALVVFVALSMTGVGAALAAPQSGDQPGVTVDLNPHPPYAGTTTVNVSGAGFQSGGSGVSGIVYQAAALPDGTTAVGLTSVPFTSNSQGTFTATLQVSPTFRASGSGGADFPVDCTATGVTCFVEATSNSGAFSARHSITFVSGTSTSTSTTLPPTSTSTSTTTTLPPTSTSTSTTTTLPPTTPPANPLCSALLQLRSQVSATLDALGSSFPPVRPFSEQVKALLDQFVALFGCGEDSAVTAVAPPPAGAGTGNGLNIGDLFGVTRFGQPAAGSEQAVTGEYVVVPGDTLSALSQRLFGDGDLYPTLLEMNQDRIDDADAITPGQVLRIPAAARG